MTAKQLVRQPPEQGEDHEGKTLHHQMQAAILQAAANLLAGQVDTVQEEHQEHPAIDQVFGMHCPAAAANIGEQPGQEGGEEHAAEEPVGYHAFKVFERLHRRAFESFCNH
ncbi:hypothetical protein D3C78_568300 [compost metagenome]